VPVVWSETETHEILRYLTTQAARARPDDAEVRLKYLSREAWHVADRADGTLKADAVGLRWKSTGSRPTGRSPVRLVAAAWGIGIAGNLLAGLRDDFHESR